MGPSLIFDKSALESLNPDEAVWLDNFFLSNITPLFFVETLADLEKKVRAGRKPEDVVGNIALKTPDYGSKCNVHHDTLLRGELSGLNKVEMSGRPIVPSGQTVELDGKTGVIIQQSPEEDAFQRWERAEFIELERTQAKVWRRGLAGTDLEEYYRAFQKFFPIGKPKTFEDVKKLVDFQMNGPDQKAVLIFGLTFLGIPRTAEAAILERWRLAGKPQVKDLLPYFSHVLSVDLFFGISIAADLIGRGRPSHTVDIAYLYYLPFCSVFTSNDKLHTSIAPFFLREDQCFILGTDLKKDLSKLDAHYDALPKEVKERGVTSFAVYPPAEGDFLVARLWDKYMNPKWREWEKAPESKPDAEASKKILEEINRFKEDSKPTSSASVEVSQMLLERKVSAKKGKWSRFSPEVIKAGQAEEEGESDQAEVINP